MITYLLGVALVASLAMNIIQWLTIGDMRDQQAKLDKGQKDWDAFKANQRAAKERDGE